MNFPAPRTVGEAGYLVLGALVRRGEAMRTPSLAEVTGLNLRQVSDAVGKLALRGWVTRPQTGVSRATDEGREALEAGLMLSVGPNGPNRHRRRIPQTFRGRAWRSMRMRGTFTPSEVAADARREETDAVESAYRYIRVLERAGYVVRLSERGVATARYRLVQNTGPLPPVWSRARAVLQDDNLARAS